MKTKINVILITAIVTIIFFAISTYAQKQIIWYEAKITCLILNSDISMNQKVEENMFAKVDMPISIIANTKVIQSFSEIDGLYTKDNILKGQIALKDQFDTKENLSIYETESGYEKISIKIQNAENGISYAVKENSLVNLYATIRNEYANEFLLNNERLSLGNEYDGYTVIKILDSVKVIGAFNVDGYEIKTSEDGVVDTVMIGVTPDEAKQINLIREIATFNLTGVNKTLEPNVESGESGIILNEG